MLGDCVRVIYYFHFDYKKRNNGSVQQQVFFLVYLLPVLLVYYYENQKMDSREYVHKVFFSLHIYIICWVDLMQIYVIIHSMEILLWLRLKWKCFTIWVTHQQQHSFVNIISSFWTVQSTITHFFFLCLHIIYSWKKNYFSCVRFLAFFLLEYLFRLSVIFSK